MSDFNTTLDNESARRLHAAKLQEIQAAHRKCMARLYADRSLTKSEKKHLASVNLQQCCAAMVDWHQKNIDQHLGLDRINASPVVVAGYMSGSGPDDAKSGRRLSKETLRVMSDAFDKIESGIEQIGAGHRQLKDLAVEAPGGDDAERLPGEEPGGGEEVALSIVKGLRRVLPIPPSHRHRN